tara:strand:- start:157 stop:747 length:591 start_codon:yes stop_codon:yes gene_type:complete
MNPDKIRKVYAPYSTTGEQVGQTPLEGYVDVAQAIYPAVNTGQIGKDGEWSGVTVSDKSFFIDATHEGVPDGETVLSPQTANRDFIDMTGFKHIQFALKPSRAGNYAIATVMGPDTNSYANLSPVNAAADLKGNQSQATPQDFEDIFYDSAEAMTANVWNIFMIKDILSDQKLLQFKVVNNSGGVSNIDFAYMRLV